jgi:GNAT superfamily N-acetyltransferase
MMNDKALNFRQAINTDLPTLVNMLADDPLGAMREEPQEPLNLAYTAAFQAINNDPNNELIVAELKGQVIGMLQLTFIPYLTYIGSWRCLVEGVRIAKDYSYQGFGTKLFQWAIERAKQKKCALIQLTTDKQRPNAIEFYEKLGFTASHVGFKLHL